MLSSKLHSAIKWGDQSVDFSLPGFNARFNGLSVYQKQQIVSAFSDFVVSASVEQLDDSAAEDSDARWPSLSCDTYRLNKPISLPASAFDLDGFYAPKKTRKDTIVEITGADFYAKFELTEQKNDKACLCVAQEQELPKLEVFENLLRIYSAHNAIRLGGCILHSAGFVIDQQAYLFVGYSGVGKTTLTRKAHDYGATVLSDDINLLLPSNDGYLAYKVPFTGEFGRTVNTDGAKSYPLKALVLLEQGAEIVVQRASAASATSRLIAGSPFINTDDTAIDDLFEIYADIAKALPVLKLAIPLAATLDDILMAIKKCTTR